MNLCRPWSPAWLPGAIGLGGLGAVVILLDG